MTARGGRERERKSRKGMERVEKREKRREAKRIDEERRDGRGGGFDFQKDVLRAVSWK
jgi:hypothetical protein